MVYSSGQLLTGYEDVFAFTVINRLPVPGRLPIEFRLPQTVPDFVLLGFVVLSMVNVLDCSVSVPFSEL